MACLVMLVFGITNHISYDLRQKSATRAMVILGMDYCWLPLASILFMVSHCASGGFSRQTPGYTSLVFTTSSGVCERGIGQMSRN